MILKNIFLNINMVLKNNKLKKRQFISDKQSFFLLKSKLYYLIILEIVFCQSV
jgi:hypothetical protein